MKHFGKHFPFKFSALLLAIFVLSVVAYFALTARSQMENEKGEAVSPASETELVLEGKRLYYTAFGKTLYACIYCHANFDEEKLTDGYLRPGHQLYNSFHRTSFYNGAYKAEDGLALERAINTCLVAWLDIDPLSAEDAKMKALKLYIASISPDEDVPTVSVVKSEVYPEQFGDPRNGEKLYKSACVLCHRADGSAMELKFEGPFEPRTIFRKIRGFAERSEAEPEAESAEAPKSEEKPEKADTQTSAAESKQASSAESSVKADEAKAEGEANINQPSKSYGKMPFFPVDRLTDQDVADILAYLEWVWGKANVPPAKEEGKPEGNTKPSPDESS